MCFIYSCFFLTPDEYLSIDRLTVGNKVLDADGTALDILGLYKIPEFKIIKMVRIMPDSIEKGVPNKKTYLKPTQYINFKDKVITAKDLVEKLGMAEYERLNILYFYLLNVAPKAGHQSCASDDSKEINEFVICNGLEVSVYNARHPLNNRFKKFAQ